MEVVALTSKMGHITVCQCQESTVAVGDSERNRYENCFNRTLERYCRFEHSNEHSDREMPTSCCYLLLNVSIKNNSMRRINYGTTMRHVVAPNEFDKKRLYDREPASKLPAMYLSSVLHYLISSHVVDARTAKLLLPRRIPELRDVSAKGNLAVCSLFSGVVFSNDGIIES